MQCPPPEPPRCRTCTGVMGTPHSLAQVRAPPPRPPGDTLTVVTRRPRPDSVLGAVARLYGTVSSLEQAALEAAARAGAGITQSLPPALRHALATAQPAARRFIADCVVMLCVEVRVAPPTERPPAACPRPPPPPPSSSPAAGRRLLLALPANRSRGERAVVAAAGNPAHAVVAAGDPTHAAPPRIGGPGQRGGRDLLVRCRPPRRPRTPRAVPGGHPPGSGRQPTLRLPGRRACPVR